MKKPKISLDKEKLQQFFLLHIEKILLGVIVCLMLLVVWRGYSLPAFKDLSPQALVDKSTQAKAYIDNPERWNEVAARRTALAPMDVVKRVTDVQRPSDPLAYMLVNTWSRPDFPKLSPREDPELFAPINLVVRPVFGAIASYPRNESEMTDPLYPGMSDEDRRAKQKKLALDKKKKDKEAAKLGGEGGMMPGGGEGMPGQKRKKGKTPAPGEDTAPGPRGSMAGGYGGEYGGMGMPGDRYAESLQVGYAVQDSTNTIARYMPSITIMAVLPIQRQTEEFDKKLSNSLDYEPRRDSPLYIDFRVQRADVTELDPTAPIPDNRWENIARPEDAFKEMLGDADRGIAGIYAGFPTEVVDPTYLPQTTNPEFPSHPAPPYLQRDLWDLLTHPDVPLAAFQTGYGELAGAAGAGTPKAAGGDDDAPLARVGGPGMPGMPGGGEGGSGLMRGPGMMPGGPGGMMPGGPGGMRPPMYGGGGSAMGPGMMPGGGFRPGRGSDEGGYGGGYGAAGPTYTPPKYQLIRYTDMHVEPYRKYRYRIRVRLQDPNHPNLAFYQSPSAASLHKSVRDRLAPIDEADKAKGKDQNGFPIRTYWKWTDWSEASPVAELPSPGRVYALKVVQPPAQSIRGVNVVLSDPTAQAFAVVFDPAKGADVPAENDKVTRGSVLNFTPTDAVKLIHPVNKEVIDLHKDQKDQKDKYNITTNVMVADMMGGERMKSVSGLAQPLSALGELLVMDANGNLHVQNEAQDGEQIRRYTVPKEDKKAKTTTDPSGLSGDMPGPGGRPARSRD